MTDHFRFAARAGHFRYLHWILCLVVASASFRAGADELPATVARIKPSIVGIGTFRKTRNPSAIFGGTGFAVGDGLHVVTNAHVIPPVIADPATLETLIVLVGTGEDPDVREARVVATRKEFDLALLRIEGAPLPALALGDSGQVREGQPIALTGFPVGMALGLYPATHRGILAAIVPVARPGITARQLNARMIARIRDSAYSILQLDATAFPGNSGSPVYDPASGTVYGIVNSVFIRGTREQAISRPSGITYAIPSNPIREMLDTAGVGK